MRREEWLDTETAARLLNQTLRTVRRAALRGDFIHTRDVSPSGGGESGKARAMPALAVRPGTRSSLKPSDNRSLRAPGQTARARHRALLATQTTQPCQPARMLAAASRERRGREFSEANDGLDAFERTIVDRRLAKDGVDERGRETAPFERAREARITCVRLRAAEFCERLEAAVAFAVRCVGDRALRALRIESSPNELADEPPIPFRVARALDVERGEERIVKIALSFATRDRRADGIVVVAATLQARP